MRLTIVLIDDDSDDIELMQEAIAEVDPEAICMPFTNPGEAIKSLLDTRLDFVPNHIFIDHNMPEMTGLECVKVLRSMKEFDTSSITVISTSMDAMDSKLFSSMGANFTFQKPVSLSGYFNLLRIVFELDAV
ncbi:response regulator [Chryseolinea sp. T2]|uniref:response regulator n=1 Tax=Chryseolinea sp. T2 TaxID=3129255 RepID=UPI0030772B29